MRLFSICLLTISLGVINAQQQYVFPTFRFTPTQVTADRTGEAFYVSGVVPGLNNIGANHARLSKWSIAGELLWERVMYEENDSIFFARDAQNSLVVDLNDSHLLYVGWPGVDCDIFTLGSLIYLIEKESGAIVFAGNQIDQFEDLRLQKITHSLSPDGKNCWISLGGRTVHLQEEDGLYSINTLPSDIHASAIDFVNDSIVAYVNIEPLTPGLIFRNIQSGENTIYPLPEWENISSLKVVDESVFIGTDNTLYRFEPAQNTFDIVTEFGEDFTLQKRQNTFLFLDASAEQFYQYFPSADSLSPVVTLASNTQLAQVYFDSDSTKILLGRHRFDDGNGHQKHYGYWYRGDIAEITPTATYQLAISENAPVELVDFTLTQSSFDGEFRFDLSVTNTGSLAIDSFTITVSHYAFLCGPITEDLITFDLSDAPLFPGETYNAVDTFNRWYFANDSGQYVSDFTFCAGRPNGQLELSQEDNCVSGIVTSVETINLATSSVKVFPNPTNNSWEITELPDHQLSWSLLNINGQVLQSGSKTPGINRLYIDATALPSQLYFLQLNDEEGLKTIKLLRD